MSLVWNSRIPHLTEFVAALGTLRKKNHHSKAKPHSKLTLTVILQKIIIYQSLFLPCKNQILTRQVSVRTLDRVSELWTGCPYLGHASLIYLLTGTLVLSVSTSQMISSTAILSPTAFSHLIK